jgi:GNAT superfamily N-acetyltransferase
MTSAAFELRPLLDHLADVPAEIMNRAFKGYVGGETTITPALFAQLMAAGDVSPSFSRVAYESGTPVALALIARRGWRSRLAAMGVVPEAKGRGVGTTFLARLLDEARTRGERIMELECFEQNAPGVRLYARAGFVTRRRLLAYSGALPHEPAELRTEDPAALAEAVAAHGLVELPWQISAPSLLKAGYPQHAYRLGRASALVTESEDHVQLSALVTEREARGRGEARRLLRAIAARRPSATWRIAPLCPEEVGGFFEKMGLTRGPLNQLHMVRVL